jgi:hypothetical protein
MFVAASHVWPWQTPSWNWAELWALAVLLVVSLIPLQVPRKRLEASGGRPTTTAALFVVLLNGKDGRWSTSKASAVLWTYAVWFAFLAIPRESPTSRFANSRRRSSPWSRTILQQARFLCA